MQSPKPNLILMISPSKLRPNRTPEGVEITIGRRHLTSDQFVFGGFTGNNSFSKSMLETFFRKRGCKSNQHRPQKKYGKIPEAKTFSFSFCKIINECIGKY